MLLQYDKPAEVPTSSAAAALRDKKFRHTNMAAAVGCSDFSAGLMVPNADGLRAFRHYILFNGHKGCLEPVESIGRRESRRKPRPNLVWRRGCDKPDGIRRGPTVRVFEILDLNENIADLRPLAKPEKSLARLPDEGRDAPRGNMVLKEAPIRFDLECFLSIVLVEDHE